MGQALASGPAALPPGFERSIRAALATAETQPFFTASTRRLAQTARSVLDDKTVDWARTSSGEMTASLSASVLKLKTALHEIATDLHDNRQVGAASRMRKLASRLVRRYGPPKEPSQRATIVTMGVLRDLGQRPPNRPGA
ncbi:MAG: hypothetical protein AAF556_10510 [Pseudomonadota bacterium]